MAATLDELKDLLASLDPDETKKLLASTRPQENWSVKDGNGKQKGIDEAKRRFGDKALSGGSR